MKPYFVLYLLTVLILQTAAIFPNLAHRSTISYGRVLPYHIGVEETLTSILSGKAASNACPFHPLPVALPNPLPTTITNALNAFGNILQEYFLNSTNVPGLSAVVVYQNQILWKQGYGSKDKTNPNTPPDENTIFRIASVSKVFPTLMMYQLAEKQTISSIDDVVSDYAPDFAVKNPYPSAGVTFRQLASQLSGLPREVPCVSPCNVSTDEIFTRLQNTTLILPPNTRPSYSNLGFAVLGRVLGIASDNVYEDYVEANILSPLGMDNSGFQYTEDVLSKMATGYDSFGNPVPIIDLGWGSPAGQMYSTTSDLAKLMIELFQTESDTLMLEEGFLKELFLPVFWNADGQTLFGTPWEIQVQQNYMVRRKGGNLPGFTTLFATVPELQLGVVVMLNGGSDEFALSNAAFDILIPAFVQTLTPLQPHMPVLPPNPSSYAGSYQLRGDPSVVATISYVQNVLVLRAIIYSTLLTYENPGVFRSYIPPGILDCFGDEVLALNYQFVYFEIYNGQLSFSIPGFAYGLQFDKQ